MHCPSCDVINPASDSYCFDCGDRLHPPPWELEADRRTSAPTPILESERTSGIQVTCQRCRATNEPGAIYCYECGLPLEDEPAYSALQPPSVPVAANQAYRSSRTRARWTIGLILGVCFVSIGYMVALSRSYELLFNLNDGQFVSRAALVDAADEIGGAAAAYLVVYVASAIAFLMWQHRVSTNLRRIGVHGQRFSPTWAIVWWFVPIMHLFRPYQVMSEIWRGSTATIQETWNNAPVPGVLGVWWGLHLIGGFFGIFGWVLTDDFDLPTRASTIADMLSIVALVCDGIILIYFINRITDRQEEKALYITGND